MFNFEAFELLSKEEKKKYAEEHLLTFPLLPAQSSIWFLDQLYPGNSSYNLPLVLKIYGNLDKARLRDAFCHLVEKHQALRTRIINVKGVPRQFINGYASDYVDFQDEPMGEDTSQIEDVVTRITETPFNLNKGVLYRARLLSRDVEHIFIFVAHHIISDGWSLNMLLKELAEFYNAGGKILEGSSTRSTYQMYLQGATHNPERVDSASLEFWKQRLQGMDEPVLLPYMKKRDAIQTFAGGKVCFSIPTGDCVGLRTLSRTEGVTISTSMACAFALFLYRLTGKRDIVIGTTVADRSSALTSNLFGLFVNSIPVRLEIDPNWNFARLVSENKHSLVSSLTHSNVPFEKIVRVLQPNRDLSVNPLYQISYVFHYDSPEIKLNGLEVSPIEVRRTSTRFDFEVHFFLKESSVDCAFHYNRDLFAADDVDRMSSYFQTLVTQIVARPEAGVGELNILTSKEIEEISIVNDTAFEFDRHKCLHEIFQVQVVRTPLSVVVSGEGYDVSYDHLNRQANRLSRMLKSMNIGGDELIGICLDRSFEMILGIVGVLKSGAAYVPISPDEPVERLQRIISKSKVNILLTNRKSETVLAPVSNLCRIICLDNIESDLRGFSDQNPDWEQDPGSLAYAIYTSGSTGEPKGVMIEHVSVVNRLNWMQREYGIGSHDVILQKTPFTFDVSVWELIWPLLTGAKLFFAPPGSHREMQQLIEIINRRQVSVMHFVPSLFSVFLEVVEVSRSVSQLGTLKYIFCSGEALKNHQVGSFNRLFGSTKPLLVNLYGPTEATVDVSFFNCSEVGDSNYVPIGKPIDNTSLLILNENYQHQPIGISGELFIGGVGLARGYYNREDLTTEKFLDLKNHGGRFYRTGDLAKWRSDRNIDFVGRIDSQIKLHGNRIELGEIEMALQAYEYVTMACCRLLTSKDGSGSLCAYVVSKDHYSESSLRSFLKVRLPEYMVPSYIMQIESIPVTKHGKADLTRLPLPEVPAGIVLEKKRNTSDSVEEQLVDIWSTHLAVSRVGLQDNYFSLGGHSLGAIRLVFQINKILEIQLTVIDLFQNPTISSLASVVRSRTGMLHTPIEPVTLEKYPATLHQKRLYFQQMLDKGSIEYNISLAYLLKENVSLHSLSEAFQKVLQKHSILRTSFENWEDNIYQRVHSNCNLKIESTQSQSGIPDLIKELTRPFDLGVAPLLRVEVVKTASGLLLFVDCHHIIFDGVSIEILLQDLQAFFNGTDPLSNRIEFKDFAVWCARLNEPDRKRKQIEYYRSLNGINVDRPAVWKDYRGGNFEFHLEEKLVVALRRFCVANGVSLNMLLTCSYAFLLSKSFNRQEILLGTVVSERNRDELANCIGMFANTVPLICRFSGAKSFSAYVGEMSSLYYSLVRTFQYLTDEPIDSATESPLSAIDFAFVGQTNYNYELNLSGVDATLVEFDFDVAKFDLTLAIWELEREIKCRFTYRLSAFDQSVVRHFADWYSNLLEKIVECPDSPTDSFTVLTETDLNRINGFNETSFIYERDRGLMDVFMDRVKENGSKRAIVAGGEWMSYVDLDEMSNRVGRYLKSRGVVRGDLVGVCMDRSLWMVVSILGIMKAGCGYVPLDRDYPQDRLSYMLKDAGVCGVITDDSGSRVLESGGFWMVNLDEDMGFIKKESGKMLEVKYSADEIAYVMYTSGTTGKPKGTMVRGRNILKLVQDGGEIQILSGDEVLQWSNYAFDGSVYDIFCTLLNGATLHMIEKSMTSDVDKLSEVMEREGITVCFMTTALFNVFAETEMSGLVKLRKVLFGGEQVSVQHVQKAFDVLGSGKMIHVYGPTETTVYATAYLIKERPGDSVPIGKPLSNTRISIMDQWKQLSPIGIWGEIYIGGDGVSGGYLNLPDLTDEKFVVDTFGSEGSRLYRTGDIGRWDEEGNIEFLGRTDDQVKIRGYRIELGEIESALRQLPSIRQGVVLVEDEGGVGEKRLVGYVVPEGAFDRDRIRRQLRESLPEHMVPSYWVELEAFPLTINGKIDKKALRAMTLCDESLEEENSVDDIWEARLLNLWTELLGQASLKTSDNFFECGGHSLILIRLLFRIKELGVELKLDNLLACQTIKLQANAIRATLAARNLGSSADGKYHDHVISISGQMAGPIVFLIPGSNGVTDGYYELARSLSMCNVYGVQMLGVHHDEIPLSDISEIAKTNVGWIREMQPVGPYRLIGHSFGALVVYEMIKLLESMGEDVDLACLIDYGPALQLDRNEIADFLSEIGNGFSKENKEVRRIRRLIDQLKMQLLDPLKEPATEMKNLTNYALLQDFGSDAFVFRWLRLQVCNLSIQYKAEGMVKTPLIVIQADEERAGKKYDCSGWESFSAEVKFLSSEGDHFTMVRGKNADLLGRKIIKFIK